ncbi:D-hexose-6-phosphate mutarotase [Rhodoferax sp. U11-2br]|uniref:D-hexose-6-phosphate mutarotase n=1 Tax=Rhodoferax sp. U11-2br TaxID=2838878 RepID=UPI001BE6ED9F|nr:D-hexose-6-phosphate mutarotase [Rhodoferax sp. U11-2br]MBT3066400.1 D-hexose-6-phosphate mutarotase [Rhodoferax sp. U11-2br]
MTQTLSTLNTTFALGNSLRFTEAVPGLPVAEISTPLATASVALHGAHVLSWQPAGQAPVIWVSKAAIFELGKPVRGGVPLCWPWFGPLADKPMHGFVRTMVWQVRGAELDASGQLVLRLGISDDASTRALWDFAFDLELVITVGSTLTIALTTRNTGATPLSINQALHTYFATSDINQTTVQGLAGGSYINKVQNFAVCQQDGDVVFTGETDRIYTDTKADSVIVDGVTGRRIRIAKQGSASTVVWNPWSEKEKNIVDMAAGEHRQMVCVETCNAGPDSISIPAGGVHTLAATISVA